MDCLENLHLLEVPQQFHPGAPPAARHLKQALLLSLALHLAGGLLLTPYLLDATGRLKEPQHDPAIWVVTVPPPEALPAPAATLTQAKVRKLQPKLPLPAALPARQATNPVAPSRGVTQAVRPTQAVKEDTATFTATVPVQAAPAPIAAISGPAQLVLPSPGVALAGKGKAGIPHAVLNKEGEAAPAAPGPYSPAGYQNNPPPDYPSLARRLRQQGTAVLRVWVSALGSPEQVTLKDTSGSRILDQAAQEAVRQWRFAPARNGSNSVASWVEVPVTFRLK
jgi:periplasmic protein TonB